MNVVTGPVHNERVAARLGLALGFAFTICFATGLYSHFAQHPTFGFVLPARPVGLYRVTQGLHVVTGLASIPLLLAKLWSVYPKLFQWPPFDGIANLIERLAIFPLVAGSIFMLFTGLANINLWYPWRFNFPDTHYRTSFIVIGALMVHIGAKFATTRRALARPKAADAEPEAGAERRRFLATAFGLSALVAVFTVGQTFRPLTRLALLVPRRPDVGPQGFPVNGTAKETGVLHLVSSPDYRLEVTGKVGRRLTFTLEELRALPQHSATLPITCVEGWSTSQRWTGIRVRDLLAMAGAAPEGTARVESFQPYGSYTTSELNHLQAHDPDTLLALEVNGEPLAPDHGFPLRLIAPNRPGVMQTKWIKTLIISQDVARTSHVGLGIGLLFGVPTMLIGVLGLVRHTAATPPSSYLKFLIGGDLVHDLVVAPLAVVVAVLVLRRVPAIGRAPLRAALFGAAVVVAIAWPGIRGYGRMRAPDNASVQPLNYATATLTAVAVIVAIAATWFLVDWMRARRAAPADRAARGSGS